ncbi:MAG: tlde1 domain-containing protein [Cereibacter sp.]
MTEIVRGHFDGIRIRFYDAEDRLVSSTLAVSGRPLAQNPKFQGEKNLGPIPEGEWVISSKVASNWNPFDEDRIQRRESGTIAAWGEYRVALRPLDGTNTHSRTDFYLHGSRDGNGYGSAGCIDVNTDDEALFLQLIANGASEIPITVKYDDRLRNGFHPVFNGDPIFNAYIEVLEEGIPGLFPPTPREDLLDGG